MDSEGLVPRDWQLIRSAANDVETIMAENLLAYDFAPDGRIIYANGATVFLVSPDGR